MRVLHNSEAERDLLSIIIRDPNSLFRSDHHVSESIFFNALHKSIFTFVTDQYKKGEFIIVPSVYNGSPRDKSILEKIANNKVPSAAFDSLVETLADLSMLRNLHDLSQDVLFETTDGTVDGGTLIDLFSSNLTQFQLGSTVNMIPDISKDLDELISTIETRKSDYDLGKPLELNGPITNTDLDKCIIGGFAPGDLVIVAATPSTGKSQLALQIALENLHRGTPIAFFSLEMNKTQLLTRLISNFSGIDSVKIKTGADLSEEEMKRVKSSANTMKLWHLYIDDRQAVKLSDIVAKTRKLKFIEPNLGLVIIDYLQLVDSNSENGNRNLQIGNICRTLKVLSGQIDTPIMLLSQLSRDVEKREDGKNEPRLSDLRDSGEIEAHADIVIFLHASLAEKAKKTKSRTKISVAKNRNNPTGHIISENMKPIQRFVEVESHVT